MTSVFLALLMGVVLQPDDGMKLQGRWVCETAELPGSQSTLVVGDDIITLTVRGPILTVEAGDDTHVCIFKVFPASRQMRWVHWEGTEVVTYRFEDEELVLEIPDVGKLMLTRDKSSE